MSTDTWYQGVVDPDAMPPLVGYLDVNDLRDFSVVTANYAGQYGGLAALPTGGYDPNSWKAGHLSYTSMDSSVTCTAGGVGVGVITITIPAKEFSGGGHFSSVQVVTRPLTIEDVARYGGTVTNIDTNMADTAATYSKLSTWSNAGAAP